MGAAQVPLIQDMLIRYALAFRVDFALEPLAGTFWATAPGTFWVPDPVHFNPTNDTGLMEQGGTVSRRDRADENHILGHIHSEPKTSSLARRVTSATVSSGPE